MPYQDFSSVGGDGHRLHEPFNKIIDANLMRIKGLQ